ncbi:MAG: imidazoleglycerol-phosphate dehydratase HisB [Oscillospiraceae bacterium]|jgi:imidazoleglycerol-phosphate dehydratase|nr:imidazoleglycerol-phosphate dehydratase HisB [Oscillospiraceae bacterium]
MRTAEIRRKTTETDIALTLNLDGEGRGEIDTGIGFLDHMLTLFARHGRFDLSLKCDGDRYVDDHHSAEDIGICLGAAFSEAIGDGAGITRYGDIILPMDEALVLAAVDISGRGGLELTLPVDAPKVGSFDTELVREFFLAFTRRSGVTLHIQKLAGSNAHHIIEACFKAAARALSKAVALDIRLQGEIPSTKGVL